MDVLLGLMILSSALNSASPQASDEPSLRAASQQVLARQFADARQTLLQRAHQLGPGVDWSTIQFFSQLCPARSDVDPADDSLPLRLARAWRTLAGHRRSALEDLPDVPAVLVAQILTELQLEGPSVARSAWASAIAAHPGNPDLLVSGALLSWREDRRDAALEQLKAVEPLPSWGSGLLAHLSWELGRKASAAAAAAATLYTCCVDPRALEIRLLDRLENEGIDVARSLAERFATRLPKSSELLALPCILELEAQDPVAVSASLAKLKTRVGVNPDPTLAEIEARVADSSADAPALRRALLRLDATAPFHPRRSWFGTRLAYLDRDEPALRAALSGLPQHLASTGQNWLDILVAGRQRRERQVRFNRALGAGVVGIGGIFAVVYLKRRRRAGDSNPVAL